MIWSVRVLFCALVTIEIARSFRVAGGVRRSARRTLAPSPHAPFVRRLPTVASYRKTTRLSKTSLFAEKENGGNVEEYRNAITAFLSNFVQGSGKSSVNDNDEALPPADDPLANIKFDAPKIRRTNLQTLASLLDAELYEKEWFVTGQVNPSFFDDSFEFQDPDVKLSGIEDYARGVYKLFDQETSRCEIISTVVNSTVPNTITVTWRLSGAVNIGPGLTIKPYVCYTDFTVSPENGLIVFQEDRFDIPSWDILLSAIFPFLIGKITAPPAPPVPPRTVSSKGKPSTASPLDSLLQLFQ